jgi:hypothetical protein
MLIGTTVLDRSKSFSTLDRRISIGFKWGCIDLRIYELKYVYKGKYYIGTTVYSVLDWWSYCTTLYSYIKKGRAINQLLVNHSHPPASQIPEQFQNLRSPHIRAPAGHMRSYISLSILSYRDICSPGPDGDQVNATQYWGCYWEQSRNARPSSLLQLPHVFLQQGSSGTTNEWPTGLTSQLSWVRDAAAGKGRDIRCARHDVRLTYQPLASNTFLSQQISHQQPANNIFSLRTNQH